MTKTHNFKSNDFLFRPTAMGEAFVRAFGGTPPHLVRESKLEGLLRARSDKTGEEPSIVVTLSPIIEVIDFKTGKPRLKAA